VTFLAHAIKISNKRKNYPMVQVSFAVAAYNVSRLSMHRKVKQLYAKANQNGHG
jgi:hypothetical protein